MKVEKRSVLTTIVAGSIGLVALFVALPLLPINSAADGLAFCFCALLAMLCAIIAIEGKKGTLRDVIDAIFWWG